MPKSKKSAATKPEKAKSEKSKLKNAPKLEETPMEPTPKKIPGKPKSAKSAPTAPVIEPAPKAKPVAKSPSVRGRKTVKAIRPAAPGAVEAATAVPQPAATSPTPRRRTALSITPPVPAPEVVITQDAIAERAYYIAERRRSMGWPGDSESDWLEAEKQLRAEAGGK